jgi:hypothetical protein
MPEIAASVGIEGGARRLALPRRGTSGQILTSSTLLNPAGGISRARSSIVFDPRAYRSGLC